MITSEKVNPKQRSMGFTLRMTLYELKLINTKQGYLEQTDNELNCALTTGGFKKLYFVADCTDSVQLNTLINKILVNVAYHNFHDPQ